MRRKFDPERFDLVNADRVHVTNHRFGRDSHGDLDVWTTKGETGTAFVHQISVGGTAGPPSQGIYGRGCFFLRERVTGRFYFLELDARGFTLQSDDFFGAAAYFGEEAVEVEAWLKRNSAPRP